MKSLPLLVLSCIALCAARPAHPEGDKVFRWDAGAGAFPPERHGVRVDAADVYTPARGYGFISRGLTTYRNDGLASLGIGEIADGVTTNGPIVFRIDAPAGRYFVEVLMDAGRFTAWKGSISVNGTVVAGPLACFGTNTEGEMPPPFWSVMVPVITKEPALVIEVNAEDQSTTLSAIGCYPAARMPVDYVQGLAAANRPLRTPNSDLILRLINGGHATEARASNIQPGIIHNKQRAIQAIPPRPLLFIVSSFQVSRLTGDNLRLLFTLSSTEDVISKDQTHMPYLIK